MNVTEGKIAEGRADRAINLSYVRAYNVQLIMKILYEKPLSCLELSEKIGISDVGGPQDRQKFAGERDVAGCPRRERASQKRQSTHSLYDRPAYGFFLIIDFTHLSEAYEVFDYAGNLLFSRKLFSVPYEDVSDEDLLRVIGEIKRALNDWGVDCGKLLNIQICVPDRWTRKCGVLSFLSVFANMKTTERADFSVCLKKLSGFPLRQKTMLRTWRWGNSKKVLSADMAVLFIFSWGMGSPLPFFINTRSSVWRGYAGEIGGSKFGNDGTFSMNCSINRLKDKCAPYLETPDFAGLLKAYRAGGPVREIVLKSADVLGAFISMFSNFIGRKLR